MKTETRSFPAMGTTANVHIVGGDARRQTEVVRKRIGELEQRWSRFIPTSDVTRLNRGAGRAVPVHRSTLALLEFAVSAWKGTGGLFSPFLQTAMVAIGYERSMGAGAILVPATRVATPNLRVPVAFDPEGECPVTLDHVNATATIARGVGVDFGGLAKGFSADLLASECRSDGADAGLVDIGGDMAFFVSDQAVDRPVVPWRIDVDDPFRPGRALDALTAFSGGVATSSTLRRRWGLSDGEVAHHLVDPRTGWSADTDIASVTVLADSGVNAEVLAKQFVLLGVAAAAGRARDLGVDALIVGNDHSVERVGEWEKVAS